MHVDALPESAARLLRSMLGAPTAPGEEPRGGRALRHYGGWALLAPLENVRTADAEALRDAGLIQARGECWEPTQAARAFALAAQGTPAGEGTLTRGDAR